MRNTLSGPGASVTSCLTLPGGHTIALRAEKDDLLFMRAALPFHANGMRLVALDAAGATLCERTYYSVGGGFIVTDEVAADGARQKVIAPGRHCAAPALHHG